MSVVPTTIVTSRLTLSPLIERPPPPPHPPEGVATVGRRMAGREVVAGWVGRQPSSRHLHPKGLVMLWFIIVLLVVGIIAGALARLLVPGPDPMSLAGTWLLGVLGSFLGGFLGYVLLGADVDDGAVQVSGVIGSVIGAVLLLLLYRAVQRRRPHRV